MARNWFEDLAIEDWSKAVFEGAHRFTEARELVLNALNSSNGEVRSAAVATLNEANHIASHDSVVALAHDTDPQVREEVLEYIEQFPASADAALLIEKLKSKDHVFLASSALQKLCRGDGPLIEGDETPEVMEQQLSEWKEVLRQHGYSA